DLPQLQSVKLGYVVFGCVHSIVFENLPKLQSIQLDKYALEGYWHDNRKTKYTKPYNYKNTLTMRNLPSLTEFKGVRWNFGYIGSVILENIPRLSFDGIQFIYGCFRYTYSIQSLSMYSSISSLSDAAALESAIRRESDYL
ncbi:hypothetical protein WA588_006125, partial [Blastocystis sp. NMH]